MAITIRKEPKPQSNPQSSPQNNLPVHSSGDTVVDLSKMPIFYNLTMREHYLLHGCLSEAQIREVLDKYSDVEDNRAKLLDAYNLISEVLGVFPDATSIPKILAKNDNSLVHTLEVFEIKLKRALALVDSMVI